MKKVLILFVLSVFTLSFAVASGQSETAAGEEKVIEINFSSVSVPGDAHTEAMTVFKDELEKLSGGTMKVNVYHSGQLCSPSCE